MLIDTDFSLFWDQELSRSRTTDTQWRHKSKMSEKLGRCGRKDMLPPNLKIWDWVWIFGRAVKAISSLGVRNPCFHPLMMYGWQYSWFGLYDEITQDTRRIVQILYHWKTAGIFNYTICNSIARILILFWIDNGKRFLAHNDPLHISKGVPCGSLLAWLGLFLNILWHWFLCIFFPKNE